MCRKVLFLIILFAFSLLCKAQQVYPLRTFTEIPENSYLKDINNELADYEGTWKGTWNNKTISIIFKKVTNQYNNVLKYYKDYIVCKFIVKDSNGLTLFDNTQLSDDKAKIKGGKFRKVDNKYSLSYIDPDLCHITGNVKINFTDATKTKLEWKYYQDSDWTDNDCFYHGLQQSQRPDPLPKNIILTKQ